MFKKRPDMVRKKKAISFADVEILQRMTAPRKKKKSVERRLEDEEKWAALDIRGEVGRKY